VGYFFLFFNFAYAKALDKVELSKEINYTLKEIGLYSRDMHNLLMGTVASETDMGTCKTMNRGPDYGFFQIEKSNHDDIWDNWLIAKPVLTKKLRSLMWPMTPKIVQLKFNMRYQIAMAAIHYDRANYITKCLERKKFTNRSDYIWWLSYVHKKHYNTKYGKSTTTRFFDKYHEYIL
jgi:hypothetical protein